MLLHIKRDTHTHCSLGLLGMIVGTGKQNSSQKEEPQAEIDDAVPVWHWCAT